MDAITTYRKKNGLTQRDVAIALSTTPATICRWESGDRIPSASMAREIEAVLGIPCSETRPDLFGVVKPRAMRIPLHQMSKRAKKLRAKK